MNTQPSMIPIEQYMRKFPSKQGSLHRSTTLLQPQRPSPVSPASSYLKKQLSQIIKDELKTFQLRSKLEGQLQDYRQKQANKQLSKMVFDEKMRTYKERQKSSRKKKYEQFLQKQRLRQLRLRQFMQQKNQDHDHKFQELNRTIENVRQRHQLITQEDSNTRLRKLQLITSQDQRISRNSSNRALSTSHSNSHRELIRRINEERETGLVTNYINKIQQSESRVLLKELEKEKRVTTSKRSRVKCLVQQRNRHEVQLMLKAEKEYKQKMQHFEHNNFIIQQEKSQSLLTRSMLNDSNFKSVTKRRELLRKENCTETSDARNLPVRPSGKENILKEYKSAVDLANDQRIRCKNLLKMEKDQAEEQLDSTMKLVYGKLERIKNIRYGQKLDERSLHILLGMLDKADPEYAALAEFLSSQRRTFLEGWIKREEERSKFDKLKKNGKGTGKVAI